MRVEPGDVERNLNTAAELVSSSAQAGAQLALLPEALPFGWMDYQARAHAESLPDGRPFRFFADLARQNEIFLCTGLVERKEESIFNAAVLISPQGELLLHHRKIYELTIAHDSYALGDRLGVVDTPLGRLGLMICADGFAPGQAITRALCLMGAQVILSPCAWAAPPGHDNVAAPYGKLWIDNYGAVTNDFPTWIAGCSNVGPIKSGPWAGYHCIGSSLVMGPGGKTAARGSYGVNAEEIIYCEIEPIVSPRPGVE